MLFSIIYLENAERKSTIDEISIDVTDGVHNTVKDDIKGKFYLLNCKDIKGGSLLLGNSERRETFAKLRKNKVWKRGYSFLIYWKYRRTIIVEI